MCKRIVTMRFISLTLLIAVNLFCFSPYVDAQQRKIPKDPFQITDSSTGTLISEVLVIPRYSSCSGIAIAPEGPGKGTCRDYLDKPFLYTPGESFKLKTPKFTGLPLFPIFIGKGRTIHGILIVAMKYRPIFISNLWIYNEDERNLKLTSVSDDEWSLIMKEKLEPIVNEPQFNCTDYRFWDIPKDECSFYVYYNEKEQELVKSFLQLD